MRISRVSVSRQKRIKHVRTGIGPSWGPLENCAIMQKQRAGVLVLIALLAGDVGAALLYRTNPATGEDTLASANAAFEPSGKVQHEIKDGPAGGSPIVAHASCPSIGPLGITCRPLPPWSLRE